MAHVHTDKEKIDFFNENWIYLERILEVLQSSKNYMKAGTNMISFLADWLERNYDE